MADQLVLVRHGETEWTINKRHTGRTDLALTDNGRAGAAGLAPELKQWDFSMVLSSPRQRAMTTAELALGTTNVETDNDLAEWDYGDYEGLTSAEIRAQEPGWDLWTHGGPNGESPEDITVRVDRLINRLLAVDGTIALFAHGHILRVLAVRWLELPVIWGRSLALDTATISILGFEHSDRAIKRWNSPA